MANYYAIKAAVNAYIKQNGRKEITGSILNAVLNATIDSLGRFFQFAGGAMPTDDPGTPDQNVCYLATEPGLYTHFGNIRIANEEVALLFWNGEWVKESIALGIQEVNASVDNQVGTPSVDVSYSGGQLVLTFHNLKGEQGIQGETGAAAGFGTIGAYITGGVGTPGVSVETSGDNTAKNLMFHFTDLKGETGVTSVIATIDNTSGTPACQVSLVNGVLTLAFSGLKGLKGDTGVSADYPITIYNGLDSDATDQALAAAQGKVLEGEIGQLESRVTELEDNFNVESGTDVTITSVPNPIVGYMDLAGREYPTATSYIRTDHIPVIPGDRIILQKDGVDRGERFVTAFFNGTAVPSAGAQNIAEYLVPDGVNSVVMSIPATAIPLGYKLTRVVSISHIKPDRISNSSIDSAKIADKAVGYEKLDNSVIEKILPTFRTANLYDERERIDGKYINNNGAVMSATGWAMSPLIPVTPGQTYTLSCGTSARNTGFRWCDAGGDLLSLDVNIFTSHTAPEGAAFMQFNVAASGSYSTDIMVAEGATALPFAPYIQTETQYIKDFAKKVNEALESGKLTITKSGNSLSVANPDGAITAKLENNSGAVYSANPVFNFTGFRFSDLSNTGSDDIAPMHILNTTIGANHGQPCKKAKITAHGLDNTAIGTGWTKGGVTFYVMRIVDADNIIFLSQNGGTLASPSFTALTAGTIENNGNTLEVESVSDAQLVPALKNHSLKLMLNGEKEILEDGTYTARLLDVVEEYDIMNPVSTLQKIIARVGQSGDPEYDGDTAVRVKNIYRFEEGLSVLVITTIIPMQEVKLTDIMFTQAAQIKSGTKNYIPNSLPLGNGNYDFRKPLAVSWSSSIPALSVTEDKMADLDNPVNRVVQYNETYGVGFALGYLKGFGVAKNLLSYTGTAFDIRNNTGKIYPHGVSSRVGNTIDQDNIYQAVMYRAPFMFTDITTGRMSMYHFAFDGAEYVFVDYASSILDNVLIDASLNGKQIEVIESVNTELVTDIYNDGFLIQATYVEGETCYLVAKII